MGESAMLSRQVGRNIRWRRKKARLSLEELAYRASLDTFTYRKDRTWLLESEFTDPRPHRDGSRYFPRALFNCGTLDEPDYARLIAFACSTIPYYEFLSVYDPLFLGEFLGSFLMERITVAEIDSIAELYLAEVTYEAVPETIPSPDGAYCGYGIAAVHQGKRHKVRLSLMRDVTTNRPLAETIARTLTENRVPYDQFRYIARDLAVGKFCLTHIAFT